ncbi:VPS9 domain-containing protein 1-like [Amphiura filiformis]|uniref:VPS9 domain-containing protein 1-like n=1 Tax=Amphiura filiformis TaxID=82378 RepID=UPI003B215C91
MAAAGASVGLLDRELIASMKGVREAIKLDSDGKQREAYLQYLSCIQYISHSLLEDAKLKASTGNTVQSSAAQKMVRLVQQCTERSAALFETIDESQPAVSLPKLMPSSTTVSPVTRSQTPPPPTSQASSSSSEHSQGHTTLPSQVPTLPTSSVPPDPMVPPTSFTAMFPPPPAPPPPSYEFPPVPSTSPMQMPANSPVRIPSGGTSPQGGHIGDQPPAYSPKHRVSAGGATAATGHSTNSPAKTGSPVRFTHNIMQILQFFSKFWRNRKDQGSPLEVAYRENKKLMAAYRARLARMQSKKNRAAMSLTLQRRLMENMAIAKAREAALAKKIQERQQRLQEEAARRFSTTGEPTVQELELRKVYASTMEFENQVNWLQEWRIKLQESPRNLQLIHDLITLILTCKEHPLTQQLQRYQFAVYKLIYPLIQKHIEKIQQNCVPFHNVKPLELSAGVEPRVIPTDGFVTPDDPSKTIDEDLMKRLQALRESGPLGVRNPSSKSYASSTDSAESMYEDDDFDDLLSDDALVDDVIPEEESVEDAERNNGSSDDSKDSQDATKDIDNSDEVTKEPSTTQNENNTQSEENSTKEICQDSCVHNDEQISQDDVVTDEDGNIDNIVSAMREELDEALNEGDQVQHSLEEQIKRDMDIGEGKDTSYLGANPGQDDEDVDRRSSADSGVQEDRTDGDESSGTHSAISPVAEDIKPDVSNDLTIDENIGSETLTDGCDVNNVSESKDVQDNVDSLKRTDEYLDECDDVRTSDQNANDDEFVTKEDGMITNVLEKAGGDEVNQEDSEENLSVSETNERTVELELTDGESRGDVDGALEETEEERITRLQEEALARHLKTISKDVLTYMDKLLSMLVAVYDELDSAGAKEQCISVIEDHFFKIIWQPLLTLFRRVNVRKEATAATAMTKYQYAVPEHIGVIKKLSLAQPEGSVLNGGNDDKYPYCEAVQELRKLTQYYSPLDKLECIVRSSRIIIQCVGDYYEQQGKPRRSSETAIGCDDLLPILSYVIIKSAMPQIVSECSAMEEFIHEGYLFGEEGYCLTTLQTALGYVLKLAND